MERAKVVEHKLTDADVKRLHCSHDFVEQKAPGKNSSHGNIKTEKLPEASHFKTEVSDGELEDVTIKEEPMDHHKESQQLEDDPGGVAMVAEMTGSEVQRLRCKDDLMKQEATTLDIGPYPTEGTPSILVKSEVLDSAMEQIFIKEEPIDWNQQTQGVDSFVLESSSEDAMTDGKPGKAEILDEPNRDIQKSNSSSQELGLQDVARDASLPGNCDKDRPCKREKKSKREAYPNGALKAKKFIYHDRTQHPSRSRSQTPTGPSNKQRKISAQQELVNIEKEKMEWFKKVTVNDNDADRNFLLRLLPQMKNLPPKKLSSLKIKFLTLLHEAAYETNDE